MRRVELERSGSLLVLLPIPRLHVKPGPFAYVAVIAPRDEPVTSQRAGEQSARHAER